MIKDRVLNIVAPVSSLSGRTRLSKIARYFYFGNKLDIHFFGWLRSPAEAGEKYLNFPIATEYLLKGGGYASGINKIKYFFWVVKCFFLAFRIPKGSVVWALGFESAFPFVLAAYFRKHLIVFDDADRFSLAFPLPAPARFIVKYLEKWVSNRVAVHLIPGTARYDFQSDKFYILKNTPSFSELEKAKALYSERDWPKASLLINVNGWLGKDRGLPIILDVAKKLIGKDVLFMVAGSPGCDEAKEFLELPNVYNLGLLSNAEALASYYASDYVFTYYNPCLEINSLAESNKWGDAIHTGVGVIVNREVLTGEFVVESGGGFGCNYFDSDSLFATICGALDDPSLVKNNKQNIAKLRDKYPCFEDQLARMVPRLVSKL